MPQIDAKIERVKHKVAFETVREQTSDGFNFWLFKIVMYASMADQAEVWQAER